MDECRRAQREVLEKLAQAIVRRGMCAPAIFALESVQPLSFVIGQTLALVEPLVRVLLDAPEYDIFREAIEDRENLRWLADRIEELDSDRDAEPQSDGKSPDGGSTPRHDER